MRFIPGVTALSPKGGLGPAIAVLNPANADFRTVLRVVGPQVREQIRLQTVQSFAQIILTISCIGLNLFRVQQQVAILRQHGVQPTPQRLAVAQVVLGRKGHPSAEEVWAQVRRKCPTISRATVYNTLNLFVEKGLLKLQVLREGTAVFDSQTHAHHHFIDDETGEIHDIPWDKLRVQGQESLPDFKIRELQVVLRGRKR